MSEEREAIVVPPLSRDDNSLKDASGASVNITANPAQEDPFAGMNIEEFKSRAARVLDRTFSVDRLRVELPPHLWGEWVPDNAIDMARARELGFVVDNTYAPKLTLHGSNRIADAIFMIQPMELHELVEKSQRDEYRRTHGTIDPRDGRTKTQREEIEFHNAPIGLPTTSDSTTSSVSGDDIKSALGGS